MSYCQWKKTNGEFVCKHCGVKRPVRCVRHCQSERPAELLGDRMESVFKRVGITPERYKAAKKALGLPPSCNCEARKQWMNRAHAWLRGETIDPPIDEPR